MAWAPMAMQLGGAALGAVSGGKGSSAPKPPKWLRQGARNTANFGQQLGKRPYEAYTGERVAGFSPDTMAAFDMIRNNVGAATPAYQSAINAAQQGLDYQPQQVGNINASQWAGQDLSTYMNPYIDNVINAQAADQQNAYGQQYNQLASQAQAAGAFGGSRFGVAQGQLGADSVRNQALISAQLRSQGFDTAAGLLSQDVDRQNWATGLNQQTAFQNQNADLAGAELRNRAALSTGSLAGQYQNSLGMDSAALATAGQTQDQRAQQGLDVGYGDYIDRTRTYPSQQLNWMSSSLQPGLQMYNTQAAAQAAQPQSGGIMGALGGAMMGSQLGGSLAGSLGGLFGGTKVGLTPQMQQNAYSHLDGLMTNWRP